jgi:glycosyltransferase involved in cell wall biosynthesis
MLENASVVVVVPARNEAPRIAEVVRGLPPFVDAVVVVDDGSQDETRGVARAERDPRVEIVRHETSRGVGRAIVSGYRAALAMAGSPRDAFVVMAGDGQMAPSDLFAIAGPIVRGEADYVKGNRFDSREARAMPIARRVAGEALSKATSLAIGVPVHDSQCGYTAIARRACERLDLDAVWPGYGYPNDLLARLAERDLVIREVIVRPIYRGEPSGVRPWHVARIAWLLGRAVVRRSAVRRDRSGPV